MHSDVHVFLHAIYCDFKCCSSQFISVYYFDSNIIRNVVSVTEIILDCDGLDLVFNLSKSIHSA